MKLLQVKPIFFLVLLLLGFFEAQSTSTFPTNPIPTMSSLLLLSDQSGQYLVAGNHYNWAYYVVGGLFFMIAFVELAITVFWGPYTHKNRTISQKLINDTLSPAIVLQTFVCLCIGMACTNIVNGNFGPADRLTFHSGAMDIASVSTPGSLESYISNGVYSDIIKHNWYPWQVEMEWINLSLFFTALSYTMYCRLNYFFMFVVCVQSFFQMDMLQILHFSPLKRFWWMAGFEALLLEIIFMVLLRIKSKMDGGKMTTAISATILLQFIWLLLVNGVSGLAFSPYDMDSWIVYIIIGTGLIHLVIYLELLLVGKHGQLNDSSTDEVF